MNQRIALAETLRKCASSFRGGHGLHTDLSTMSFALQHMSDERFASLATGEQADDTENKQDKETAMKQANTVTGEFWCKAASDLILKNLAFSVVGSAVQTDASGERPDGVKASALPSEDIPNGSNQPGAVSEGAEPVPAAALSREQTPDIAAVLNSDMVAKAEAAPSQKAASDAAPASGDNKGEEGKPGILTQEACGVHLATETMGYGISLSAAEQEQLAQLF